MATPSAWAGETSERWAGMVMAMRAARAAMMRIANGARRVRQTDMHVSPLPGVGSDHHGDSSVSSDCLPAERRRAAGKQESCQGRGAAWTRTYRGQRAA